MGKKSKREQEKMKLIILIGMCILLMGCNTDPVELTRSVSADPLYSFEPECIEWKNKTRLQYYGERMDWTCCVDLCIDGYFICEDSCDDGTEDKKYCRSICRELDHKCEDKCHGLRDASFPSLARNEPEFAKWIKDGSCTIKEEFKNETETHCIKEILVHKMEVPE